MSDDISSVLLREAAQDPAIAFWMKVLAVPAEGIAANQPPPEPAQS